MKNYIVFLTEKEYLEFEINNLEDLHNVKKFNWDKVKFDRKIYTK